MVGPSIDERLDVINKGAADFDAAESEALDRLEGVANGSVPSVTQAFAVIVDLIRKLADRVTALEP